VGTNPKQLNRLSNDNTQHAAATIVTATRTAGLLQKNAVHASTYNPAILQRKALLQRHMVD
jgi:hypothetical protein